MFKYLIHLFKKLLEETDIRKYKRNFYYYILFRLIRKKLNYDLKVKIYNFYIYASYKKSKQSHSILRKCEFDDIKELKLIEKISNEKKILFFDCGANFGFYSLFVASLKKENEVYSFEASPNTFLDFKKNIILNNFQKIKPINLAISDIQDKQIDFKESQNDWESSILSNNFEVLTTNEIKTTTIDSILESEEKNLPQYNIVIKLDIEGHEMNAIKGAYNLLKKHSPLIIIEFSKFISQEDYKLLKRFIQDYDYGVYDTSFNEISLETVSERLKELPISMFGIGNNFLIKRNSNYENIIKYLQN